MRVGDPPGLHQARGIGGGDPVAFVASPWPLGYGCAASVAAGGLLGHRLRRVARLAIRIAVVTISRPRRRLQRRSGSTSCSAGSSRRDRPAGAQGPRASPSSSSRSSSAVGYGFFIPLGSSIVARASSSTSPSSPTTGRPAQGAAFLAGFLVVRGAPGDGALPARSSCRIAPRSRSSPRPSSRSWSRSRRSPSSAGTCARGPRPRWSPLGSCRR